MAPFTAKFGSVSKTEHLKAQLAMDIAAPVVALKFLRNGIRGQGFL